MAKLSYVPVFIKYDELMSQLSDSSRARVLLALYNHSLGYDLPELDVAESIVYTAMRISADEAFAAYDSKCRVNQIVARNAARSRRGTHEENIPFCV